MAEETEQITEMESDTDVEETTVDGAERPEESPLEQTQNAEPSNTSQMDTLTAALSERDARIAQLEAAVQSRVEEIEAVNARLAQAVDLYRASLLEAEPDLPEDMVHGATVEAVQESLERARQMVAQVRTRLEAQASLERTPLGVPARSAPNLSALSPQEKILMGLSGR